MSAMRPIAPGESAPWFVGRSLTNPHYHFSSVAGRHVALFFPGSLASPQGAAVHRTLLARRALFDDVRCSLFVVTGDEADVDAGRAADHFPGVRVLCDPRFEVAAQFGVAAPAEAGRVTLQPSIVLLDPTLRVMQWFFCAGDEPDPAPRLLDAVSLLPMPLTGPAQPQAPVLVVPRVFEPAFCRTLIAHYERVGGSDSGYMRKDADGIRGVVDYGVKRRMDCMIDDEALRRAIGARISRRLKPEIERVFRFDPTRMERYLVACYDAATGGHFKPHRDNDGDGHRQFAVTLNLNTDDYEGGDLRFPEYGLQTYRAPTGGACVFSCGLMHEATPVTRGRRYAFLPFLYDEASAVRREANNAKYPDPKHHYVRGPGPT
ncbi:MAG: 2OG-Fe(II) oxygenase [Comamonadaceae bacterium]|nr:MAG: 2OG-Fe(II) oxygenase [Comamonadaceae bacterium]